MRKRNLNTLRQLISATALMMVTAPLMAVTFDLSVQQFDKIMPDGSSVTMWGYALPGQAPTVPGPVLRVPPGDTTLILNITNSLALTATDGGVTSVVVPGTVKGMTPVMFTDATGRERVRSFTNETAPGAIVSYQWNNLRPGTFLYHSGTHPQVQVQMGLYGALIVDAAANQAYPADVAKGLAAINYVTEKVLVYSEVDPALHAAVAAGTYGTAAAMTSTLHYQPAFFLVNGASYIPGVTQPEILGASGAGVTLLRMLNAGIDTHTMVLQGLDMSVVAEDGNRYPYARNRYSSLLPALKTSDALLIGVPDGDYPLYDRRLRLTNGAASPGGMMSVLRIGQPPTAVPDSYTIEEDNTLLVSAPGVLANDPPPASGTLTAVLASPPKHGGVTLAADGSFSYTPNLNFNGVDSFIYRADNASNFNATATVTITVTPVNDAPVTVPDFASTSIGTPVSIAVLTNDYDPENDPFVLTGVSNFTGGSFEVTMDTVNGTVTFIPSAAGVALPAGTYGFDYSVVDVPVGGGALSNVGHVTVVVQ